MFEIKLVVFRLLDELCGRERIGCQGGGLHIGLGDKMLWEMWHCVEDCGRDLECVGSFLGGGCIGLWMFETIDLAKSCG